LSQEEHRDADTWAVRLWELVERGFCPEATVADSGTALRAAHELVLPDLPRRRDVFHVFYEERGGRAAGPRPGGPGLPCHAIERRSNLEANWPAPASVATA
jgi:hypothetical protein